MEIKEENRTKRQLINELKHLRRRIAELEAERERDGEKLSKDRGRLEESVNERTACTEEPGEELIQREKTEEKIRRLASAVEQSPGVKDHQKMKALVDRIRRWEVEHAER